MAANNMKNMMRQAQQMQMKMQKVQEEIQSMTYESSAGGGMVKATVQGNGRVLVRASGTEPLVRVLAEAPEERLCQEANAIVLKALEPLKE